MAGNTVATQRIDGARSLFIGGSCACDSGQEGRAKIDYSRAYEDRADLDTVNYLCGRNPERAYKMVMGCIEKTEYFFLMTSLMVYLSGFAYRARIHKKNA